jgi:PAS domain S-box-containing protein
MTRRLPLLLLTAALTVAAGQVRAEDAKPARRFVYAGDADIAPFESLDASGQPAGFNIEVLRALARDAGVEIEIRLGDWNQSRADFDAGKVDLINFSLSEERARAYLWLARTWTVHHSLLFAARSKPYPASLSELGGESIAAPERSLVAEMLQASPKPQPVVITTSTDTEALHLLKDGAVTAVGGGSLVMRARAAQLGLRDLVELPLQSLPYGLATTKGRGDELAWVPRSMARLRDAGTLDSLAEKYLVEPGPPRTWWDYRIWLLSILGVALIALTGAWFWNRTLLRRVKERTREMEEAMQRGEGLLRSLAANEQRFQTFMTLSSEGIARLELDEPLATFRPKEEQIAHILRTARVAECNESFARMMQQACPGDLAGKLIGEIAPDPGQVEETVRLIVESGYQIANREARRSRRNGESRWVSASLVGMVEGAFLKGLWLTQRDITPRKEAEERLLVRGRMMEAVAFSSTALLEPGSWKDHVPAALARLGEAVGVGSAYIVENRETSTGQLAVQFTHEWTIPGVPALVGHPGFQGLVWPEDSPLRKDLSERKTVARRVRDLTPHGRELFNALGLKSLLVVPIFVRDQWWGALGFGDFQNEREWLDAEIEAIKTAGASLGASLLREQAEDALRASEKKHRDIVAFAPEGIYQSTREGTVVMANQEFARLLGYERSEEVIGLSLPHDVYFDPAERERLIATHEGVGHATRVEVRFLKRDASMFWAEISAHRIEDASGQLRLFEGFVQDITPRKAAEAERERFALALERAAEEWHRTFDAVDVAIVVLDPRGRVTRINRPAVEMLGLAPDQVLAHSIYELPDQEPWRTAARMVDSVAQRRESATARAAADELSKTWEVTAYLAPAGHDREERIILVVRDISRLVALQESLRHSETMSAMGSLVAGVAHEVRNPLFSISATVDALESELGERQEYAELTELLRSQVGRLRQLMRDLLDYGKPPVLRRAPVHSREILKRAMRACSSLAKEREVRLVEEAADDMPLINVDGSRLEQVFQNLVANALQHSPRDTTVRALARLRPEADLVEFVVEDEGAGMAPDEIPHLFEPFFSRRKGGTGLGLSVVQRIVEAHGGRVSAANREGGGAIFTVRLPATIMEKEEAVNG